MNIVNTQGKIGTTMNIILVIIFVVLLMTFFGIFSAALSLGNKGDSEGKEIYETSFDSPLYVEIMLDKNRSILLSSLIKDFESRKISKSSFSDELIRATMEMMKEDQNFKGVGSCLAIEMNQETSDETIISLKFFLKKDMSGNVAQDDLSKALLDYKYMSDNFMKSKMKINENVIEMYQYYGVCK